ncbi:glycoside hydrolase family 3 N-terminal domain-containing protein [Modestobacter versicolor]|uniref:beta-N-acetylhexosaminidase n=1 Tax=Modestobacter versicolor TaxID=429133 RepID=A0A323VBA6_9ACTN|nr:glycoside hydrolase family 3 N-terminal domain-containing protein [Modestobacter versicolor]MBB3678323.1 beta-N-acetylhexosaminidase [Modestobacter versicolor]PZA22104.1 glycoside hydrolase family 3 protein [Modestobacter versicolor]
MSRTAGRRSALAATVLLALAGCDAVGADSRTLPTTTAPRTPAFPSCAEQTLARLDLGQQVGQLLMIGVPVQDPVAGYAALSDVPVGGLFLYGRSSASVEEVTAQVAQLQAAAPLPLEVAVDQEGGAVQTLRGPGFGSVPSALEQARLPLPELAAATSEWAGWLRTAGITMDLGPVADTVPAGREADNPPIGAFDRQYGSDPEQVAAAVGTVVTAMQDVGVAATVKHFPGLGRVEVNTDTDVGATDPETSADDPYLAPFAAAVDQRVAAVMVSSATYPQLDPDRLALFSPAVIGLLRDQLGFDGVVISDDVGPAVALSGTPVGERAVDAVAAGVDVVLDKDATHAAPMAQALADRAGADPAFADRVRESAGRVLALKERFGLLTC